MAEHKILIDDCEDAWDESVAAGVTSVLDNADYKVGAGSAKISPDATVAAGTILATEAMAPVDLSDCKIVKLWIKSSVDTALGDLQILLDNTPNCASPEETLDVPALSAGVWSLCDLALANPEDDTAIISVGLKYVTELGAYDIWVDDVNGCIVTPEYAQTLIRGWYPTLDKSIPVKVGDDGTVQVYDPKVFESLVVYEGTATSDGPDTSTITDTVLAGKPDFNGQLVVITSGDYKGQTRDIDQATTGGSAHVAAAFGGTIVEGTTYVILSIRPTTAEVADIEAKLDHVDYGLEALKDLIEATSIGKLQVAATTIELNQAAGDKDLFLGTDQDVVVEKLMIRIPVDVSGGAMTSLSIQTDDTTNQVFISATTGAKANLTAQSQLAWTGAVLIKVGKKIQLTIAGAATGIACDCDVIAECRAVVAGGYLG